MAKSSAPAPDKGRRQPISPEDTRKPSAEWRDRKFLVTVQIVLAARRWRSLLDERLRTIGHSAPRMEAMSSIDRAPRLSAQVQIAKHIGIEGPTLTRMLDMLEADRLVERLPDPSDRRAKLIRLTDEGHKALADTSAVAAALRDLLLAEFDDDELDQINRLVGRLLARFDDPDFIAAAR